MSKAILVINMPSSCEECPIKNSVGYGKWCAGLDDTYIDGYPIKPDWCPLKPAPEKAFVWHEDARSDWERGYNTCIDEILGE